MFWASTICMACRESYLLWCTTSEGTTGEMMEASVLSWCCYNLVNVGVQITAMLSHGMTINYRYMFLIDIRLFTSFIWCYFPCQMKHSYTTVVVSTKRLILFTTQKIFPCCYTNFIQVWWIWFTTGTVPLQSCWEKSSIGDKLWRFMQKRNSVSSSEHYQYRLFEMCGQTIDMTSFCNCCWI